MNEKKKSRNDYFHPIVSKEQENASEILNAIKKFMALYHVSAQDCVVLNALLRQLGQRNRSFPRKVLRSMQNKFEAIKNKYENQK
jgi:hypothetical protein